MSDPRCPVDPVDSRSIAVFARQYLLQVVTIQNELICRLLDERYEIPVDLAEVFEDAAITFMDLSVMIRERHVRRSEPNLELD